MSNTGERHHDKLDDWLHEWPVPARDEPAWDELAATVGARIEHLQPGSGDDAWLEPPLPLASGEPVCTAGPSEVTMPESATEKPERTSLKEIAKRVSVVPASPSQPAPSPASTPLPGSNGRRLSSASLRSSMTSRPAEASETDSGMLDLNAVREQATSLPDSGAQPASEGLFEDDAPKSVPAPKAEAAAPKKSGTVLPIAVGGVVGVLALAAAMVFVVGRGGQSAPEQSEAPMAAVAASAEPPAAVVLTAPAEEQAPAAEAADEAEAAGVQPSTGAGREGSKARAALGGGSAKTAAAKSDDKKDEESAEKPAAPVAPNDLTGAMAGAVGAAPAAPQKAADKATGPDPGTIPEKPSQGALQGAVGAVMGGAKACVAGMDAPSRASVTFGSSGKVASVSVSGPAASTAAAGCIKSALSRARVGPFKQSAVTVGVTIRP